MAKDVRRVHPRVSYEQRIRLLGADGKPVIVGRTLNISPSGIYVRAPNGCEVGSEVTCDLPLPGGVRQLRGRVTRTQSLSDDATGIGIQFFDLNTADSSSLHRALEGRAPRPVAVKVAFEGMAQPIKCRGEVTAEGLRLSTSLPFLRLGSNVQAVYDGQDAKLEAKGVLSGVRLEPVGDDGVPHLGVDVDIDSETPLAHAAHTPELSRGDAAVGGMFTTWDRPPVAKAAEASVVTAFDGPADVTAVGPPAAGWRAVVRRSESLRAWGFVAAATVTFAIVYVAINRWAPVTGQPMAGAEARGAAPAPAGHPVVVPAVIRVPPAPPEESAVEEPVATKKAEPAPKPRVRAGSTRSRPGTPFDYDEDSGRYQLRRGASIDMQGSPLLGLGGVSAPKQGGGNLRGINVPVESGSLFVVIELPRAETDARFSVQVAPSWPTPLAIVGKSPAGFTVSFGTPAPGDAHLDWLLVR